MLILKKKPVKSVVNIEKGGSDQTPSKTISNNLKMPLIKPGSVGY